ncbi:hypothetical protein GCM10023220_66100 [Streptomyces ziwulingensis]|uniref:Uncharacterized protein n=1 Tax=Streptomyces ziwulingensis TaxID=1045501 RepID=A0ABP9D4Q2_9ACTN
MESTFFARAGEEGMSWFMAVASWVSSTGSHRFPTSVRPEPLSPRTEYPGKSSVRAPFRPGRTSGGRGGQ